MPAHSRADGLLTEAERSSATPPSATPPGEVRLHRSRVVRGAYIVLGSVSLALGVLGIFLPLLPTTPFLLLAAACYARASTRLYVWLLSHPRLGPVVHAWRSSRSLPRRAKWTAIPLMAGTLAVSIVFFVESLVLQAFLAALGVVLAVFLYRIPSAD
jgi:uncharacterized protein